jgi:Holliday junction resolvase-like predicted endonuclease
VTVYTERSYTLGGGFAGVLQTVEALLGVMTVKPSKSSRHSKITGDFAESLVLYWLSKYGFECANVDHTGIDIIARNPHTGEVMGISVKSRSRNVGTEGTNVSITADNFDKAGAACNAFGCVPWFAIVVDAADSITCFLISMDHLLEIHPVGKAASSWAMSKAWLERYLEDPLIMRFEFTSRTTRWWGSHT